MEPSSLSRKLETFLVLPIAICLVSGILGALLAESPDVTMTVVRGIAWAKGLSLDETLYGIPRSVQWAHRLEDLGAIVGPAGIATGLALLLLRLSRNRIVDTLRGAVFVGTLVMAFAWRDAIEIPFTNPWDIVGKASLEGRSPATPLAQFAFIALFPAAGVGLLALIWRRGRGEGEDVVTPRTEARPALRTLTAAALAALLVLLAGDIYTWHDQVPLDTFHEGETLAPAVRWEQGQAPYRDMIIVHGPFQDPIRTVLAFDVFGRSIGAARTMESLLEILALVLFVACVFAVFRDSPIGASLAAAAILLFIGARPFEVGITVPHRDILVCLFLLSMLSLFRYTASGRPESRPLRVPVLLFTSSATPLAAFAYSVDRGSYLFLTWVAGMAILHLATSRRWRRTDLLALAAGIVTGFVCVGLSVRWAYAEFFNHAIRILPSVHGLGFCLPYPFETTVGRVPLVLIAFNASWLAHSLVMSVLGFRSSIQGTKAFLAKHPAETLLFVLSALLFLSALGRAGVEHTHYSSGFTFLLTLTIVLKHVGRRAVDRLAGARRWAWLVPVVVVSVGAYAASEVDVTRWYKFPLGEPDEAAIGESYQMAASFLKDSLSADEKFVTLTSEGVWEYILGRTSPTRFPIAVYALPAFYQMEVVRDLREAPVDYIIYRNDHWANEIDGIPWEERLPRVARHVREHYEPYRRFADQQIWRLKKAAVDSVGEGL